MAKGSKAMLWQRKVFGSRCKPRLIDTIIDNQEVACGVQTLAHLANEEPVLGHPFSSGARMEPLCLTGRPGYCVMLTALVRWGSSAPP